MPARKRKFTKEAWEKLMATVRQNQMSEAAPEPEKEEPKVEVHVHNNITPDFSGPPNSADQSLNRLLHPRARYL